MLNCCYGDRLGGNCQGKGKVNANKITAENEHAGIFQPVHSYITHGQMAKIIKINL
uniref:Uncharacterized protein n=1 Tax=Arion vulgaris TaxID=1028688 RepID=A0A0B7B9M8_9EUPU